MPTFGYYYPTSWISIFVPRTCVCFLHVYCQSELGNRQSLWFQGEDFLVRMEFNWRKKKRKKRLSVLFQWTLENYIKTADIVSYFYRDILLSRITWISLQYIVLVSGNPLTVLLKHCERFLLVTKSNRHAFDYCVIVNQSHHSFFYRKIPVYKTFWLIAPWFWL